MPSPVSERARKQTLADTPGAPAPDGARPLEGEVILPGDRFARLWLLWSPHRNVPDTDEDEARAWKAYVAIVPGEASADELYARAEAHIAGVKANGLKVGDLWKWLGRNNWRKEPPPPPSPKRRRGQRDEPSMGEMLAAKYGGRS